MSDAGAAASRRLEFSDGFRVVKRTAESPDYPMQLMLGIYEFAPTVRGYAADAPKTVG
jgi:hypothetical protein